MSNLSFRKFYTALIVFLLVSLTAFAGDFENGMALYEKKQYKEAFPLIEKAAKAGNAEAQFQSGRMYDRGEGISQDYQKAAVWYSKSANQGNVEAQNNLANLYMDGQGVQKNVDTALMWYTKSAEKGYHGAQYNLARLYQDGEGVKQDDRKAFEWYLKAAKQGNARAQNGVGYAYSEGLGTKRDDNKALYWYQKSAAQGYDKAMLAMGGMYDRGWAVEEDAYKAIDWYTKAAEKGNVSAQGNLCHMYAANKRGIPQDWNLAFKWCTKATEGGEKNFGPFGLGHIYYGGLAGQKKDFEKAFNYLSIAAETDIPDAKAMLGVMYEFGWHVKADTNKAIALYKEAASGGSKLGMKRLERLKGR